MLQCCSDQEVKCRQASSKCVDFKRGSNAKLLSRRQGRAGTQRKETLGAGEVLGGEGERGREGDWLSERHTEGKKKG